MDVEKQNSHPNAEGGSRRQITIQPDDRQADDRQEKDEYIALDRYVSTLRGSRRRSSVSQIDEDVTSHDRVPWWAPWRHVKSRMKRKEDDSDDSGKDQGFTVPDTWLNTTIHDGLKGDDVQQRRKKSGWNELTAEKENMFLKFLGYFQGPILYGACHSKSLPFQQSQLTIGISFQ